MFSDIFKSRFSFFELKELPKYFTSIKLDSALTFSILKSFSKRLTKFFFEGGSTYVFNGEDNLKFLLKMNCQKFSCILQTELHYLSTFLLNFSRYR